MPNQYTVPLANSDPQRRLGWLREAVQQAQSAIENVPGFDQLQRNTQLIQPDNDLLIPGSFSRASIRSGKSTISDVVSTLTNLKFLMNYTNQNSKYDQQADILNKCAYAWYQGTYASEQIAAAVQYSAVQYLGWLYTKWNPNFHAPGVGDVELTAKGPTDVLLLFPKENYSPQTAYAVIVIEEIPLVEAWATYPDFKDSIKPTSENASWWRKAYSKVRSGIYSFMQSAEQESFPKSFPTVTVYQMYVRDLTKNTSGRDVQMGLPGSSWAYTVPSVGSQIPSGVMGERVDPLTGLTQQVEQTRIADDVDSLLYPMRRHITFTDTCIMYDNTSRWIHGEAPVVKVQLDPWPFDYFGGCMADDIRSVEAARNQLVRGTVDSCNLKLDPPKEVNAKQFSDTEIQGMTLRKPGFTVENENFQLGPAVRPIISGPDPFGVDGAAVLEAIKYLDLQRDDLCARVDFNAIARARSSGMSGDSMETLLALAGPRTTAKASTIERAIAQLGKQLKGYFMQFYTAPRRFALFGFPGISDTDWDYDPNTLIPDEIEGIDGSIYSAKSSRYATRASRGRLFQYLFTEQIESGSLHDVTNMTRQLTMLTLQKAGQPVDWWTVAETFNLSNFGPKPEGVPDNMMARWQWQMEFMAKGQAYLQGLAQQVLMAMNPQMAALGMMNQGLQSGLQGEQGSGQEGRPNVYTAAPTQLTKTGEDGIPRTTIATSETSM